MAEIRGEEEDQNSSKTKETSGIGLNMLGCWCGRQLLTWKWFSLFDCRESPLLQDIYQQKRRERALREYM